MVARITKKDAFKGKRRKFISRGVKGLGITETIETHRDDCNCG